MKKLFIVRHAKSNRSMMDLDDIDRPLNDRGYSDAHLIGSHLKKDVDEFFLLISSPAIRALSTALIFAREFNYPPENILISSDLYETDSSMYLKVIAGQDDKYKSVMVVGHNPTVSEVIEKLGGNLERDVPTCAVSVFAGSSDTWKNFLTAEKNFLKQLIPADFKEKTHNSPDN